MKVIVVGASSGIGEALVRQLAGTGARVGAVARRKDRLDGLASEFAGSVSCYVHDVADWQAVPELFQSICRDLGGLDMIIYCAGVMPEVAEDEFNTAKDRQMIETNLSGAVAWLNEASARFQGAGHGAIVGIGSMAGDRGRYARPLYNATKAGLHTYLEALRNRLSRHGVTVCTVKPGPVATEMTAGLTMPGMMTAEAAAAKILKLAHSNGERYLKPTHWLIATIIKAIPSPIFRRLKL